MSYLFSAKHTSCQQLKLMIGVVVKVSQTWAHFCRRNVYVIHCCTSFPLFVLYSKRTSGAQNTSIINVALVSDVVFLTCFDTSLGIQQRYRQQLWYAKCSGFKMMVELGIIRDCLEDNEEEGEKVFAGAILFNRGTLSKKNYIRRQRLTHYWNAGSNKVDGYVVEPGGGPGKQFYDDGYLEQM